MYKVNLLLGVFIFCAMFIFACSSSTPTCSCNDPSSSSVSSSGSGGVVEDKDLVRKNITLDSDKSYASIDGNFTAYTENEAATHLKNIDFIAFCNPNMGCKNNSIYSPYAIKLFLDQTGYLCKEIFLYEVPDTKADIFKTATRLYAIRDTYNELMRTFSNTNDVEEIPIEEGKVFFALVPEERNGVRIGVVIGIVIIKKADAQSVELEIIERPIS